MSVSRVIEMLGWVDRANMEVQWRLWALQYNVYRSSRRYSLCRGCFSDAETMTLWVSKQMQALRSRFRSLHLKIIHEREKT